VAQTNLNYTVIRSPIDGTVVARNVDVDRRWLLRCKRNGLYHRTGLKKMLYTRRRTSLMLATLDWEGVTFKVMPSQKTRFAELSAKSE